MKCSSLLLILSAVLVCASARCTVRVSATARTGGAYQSNGETYQMYDITVTNTGDQSIEKLFAYFGYPSSASVSQTWNYASSTGEIINFDYIMTGNTYTGAGFILRGTGTPALAFSTPTCTASPTNGPTNTPTAVPTMAPTSSPTNAPTSVPACSASVQVSKRPANQNGDFTENETPAQIWDLVFVNTGSKSITSIEVSIVPDANTVVSQSNKWNLVYSSASNSYDVRLYNSLSNPGATYYGAGFVVDGATSSSPAVSILSISC